MAPVGLDTMAASTGEDPQTIEEVYEPYLLQIGYLQRTPRGRVVTPAACRHLGYEAIQSRFYMPDAPLFNMMPVEPPAQPPALAESNELS